MARVLIVDDHEPTRDMFSSILRRAGHEPATAATAEDGLELGTAVPFDVGLIDQRLPGGATGVDVVHTLRQRGVTSRLVIITAFPDLDVPFAAGCVGADGCVEGVLWDEEVLCVVHQALSGPFPVRHPASICGAVDELGRASVRDPLVRMVKEMINESLETSASVRELAARAGCSESTLRHRFAGNVGVSIVKYRTGRRVQESARRLVTTLQTVREVAYSLGYRSLSLADFREDSS